MAAAAQQMNQPAQQQQKPAAAPAQRSAADLMDEVIANTGRQKFVSDALNHPDRIAQIEELLPDFMKGQGSRLVKRAIITFTRKNDDYKDIYLPSFVRCVLEAAELGLAIDGRLAHAVTFNNKVKENGVEKWRKESQLMVDYKGILAVARRNKAITDCWARLVHENDKIRMWEEDGIQRYEFIPELVERGALKGVLSVVLFPGGRIKCDWMDNKEVEAVRSRSKSWTAKEGGSGPWKTDDGEMRKKTGIRRVLKLYLDDPAVARLLEVDNDFDTTGEERAAPPFANLAEVAAAKVEEVRKRRGRPPGGAPKADEAPSDPLPPESGDEQGDLLGDANEGDMPHISEEQTKPAPEEKPAEKKERPKAAAKPPADDDGVVG